MRLGLWALLLPCAHALWHTTFCVITAYRQESYLDQVVSSFLEQNILHYDGVGLMVVDVDGSNGSMYTLPDRELAICDRPDVEGLPSCAVRQRSLDVVASLRVCANMTTGWVVLNEDDCTLCPGAVDELVTTLAGLSRKDVSLARFSKFQRATAVPAAKAGLFSRNIRERLYTHPHDITRVEDWDPPGSLYVHSRNLYHHIGRVSTESVKNSDEFRNTYRALREDECWQESF